MKYIVVIIGLLTKWVRCFCTAIKDEETGYVKKVVNTLLDITDEKNKMIELQSLKNKLTNAASISKVGTWEWDIKDDKIWWSDEMYSIYNIIFR